MFLRNAWYVAGWSTEVKPHTLFERTIIGESLLFYRQANGRPVALDNRCPHRFAPLHRGKLLGEVVECLYHGLRFDAQGRCVYNPHGDGTIPKTACVRSFPVVEQDDLLWVWMGDPTRAKAALIPDFNCHTDPNFPTVGGVIEMHANYELITDNLMDLSHVEFVHEGVLSSEAIKRGEHEILQHGTTIYSNRWCPNGMAPPTWDRMFGNYGKPVDHWLYMRWDAPAHMLLDVGITPAGRPRAEGI
jgi:phenylpropionate dioxygenase-like ring-hydroxylating dioxygenase large terminal subunit